MREALVDKITNQGGSVCPTIPSLLRDVIYSCPCWVGASVQPLAFNGGDPIEHTKFSILFHQGRGFAIACAHNIDGASIIKEGKIKRKSFVFDPDVPNRIQVADKQGYHKNPWDRGHLVRRRAVHWGKLAEATQADRESSYWTNIAPQHEHLHDTAWGSIEDWLLELADTSDKRLCVFTGPVLLGQDPRLVNKPTEKPIQIPAGFWKIIALKHNSVLRAAAFLVWQRVTTTAISPWPSTPSWSKCGSRRSSF